LLNNRCFTLATFNESCLVSEQCPRNAICDYAAKCVCPFGMTVVNGRCQAYDLHECPDSEVMFELKKDLTRTLYLLIKLAISMHFGLVLIWAEKVGEAQKGRAIQNNQQKK
uniref:EB domain-containing protein n=1 Tax=Gongylonema pulchrum TaxID=637853 RepID=A0A183DGF8_9BILA